MKAFSMFKVWATVALFVCMSGKVVAAGSYSDGIQDCLKSDQSFETIMKSSEASALGVDDPLPSCDVSLGSANGQEADAIRTQIKNCKSFVSCARKLKTSSEKDERKCETVIKDYRSAIEKFEKACNKTGVSDCIGKAQDCENKRTDLATSGTFSDTLNNSAKLWGLAYLNNRQATNSSSNINALNKCPQLSYKSYFERKKEIENKLDKSKRDLKDAEDAIEKKKTEILEAKKKGDETITELNEKIAKNNEELTKDLDEAKRKALEDDNKRMQNERELLKKVNDLETQIALDASNAAADARLMRQRLGLDPTEQDIELGCMSSVKAQYDKVKSAMTGPATKQTKELQQALLSMFKKCKAEQDLKSKTARSEEAKKTAKMRSDLQKMNVEIDRLQEEVTTLQNLGLTKKQMNEKAQSDIQTSSQQKLSNLQSKWTANAKSTQESVDTMKSSIEQNGSLFRRAYDLRIEISKADQEISDLGPIPVDGFESSSYKDSTTEWDNVQEAEKLVRSYSEKCTDAATLVGTISAPTTYESKYKKHKGGSGSSSSSSDGSR